MKDDLFDLQLDTYVAIDSKLYESFGMTADVTSFVLNETLGPGVWLTTRSS
jgi:hypothetical protein